LQNNQTQQIFKLVIMENNEEIDDWNPNPEDQHKSVLNKQIVNFSSNFINFILL
jgi:hypothetical protein